MTDICHIYAWYKPRLCLYCFITAKDMMKLQVFNIPSIESIAPNWPVQIPTNAGGITFS